MGVKVDLHGSPSFSVCRYLRGLLGITVEEWLQSRVKRLGLFQVRQVPSPSDLRQRSASNVSDQELSGRGGSNRIFLTHDHQRGHSDAWEHRAEVCGHDGMQGLLIGRCT